MPDRYPHFWGSSQICTQRATPVKATNGEKLKMLNCKFAWISDPAANTMQTAVAYISMDTILCPTMFTFSNSTKESKETL